MERVFFASFYHESVCEGRFPIDGRASRLLNSAAMNWDSMKDARLLRLGRGLVALALALVLLASPCLSLIEGVRGAHGHAHHGSVHMPVPPVTAALAQPGAGARHGHHDGGATEPHIHTQPAGDDGAVVACCLLCEGVRSGASAIVPKAAGVVVRLDWGNHTQDSGAIPCAVAPEGGAPPGERRRAVELLRPEPAAAAPLYALTQRYLI
ncbi:MAG: hypothetical protein D6773_03170 [Alphaproteobacteria bacterium]|nr:MAG: hypothetical protein D6773_03170 [Alphaproteobacteria bacterium]